MPLSIRPTPNPDALQFVQERRYAGAPGSFARGEDASLSPVASLLLGLPGVERVWINGNVLTVTKTPEAAWTELGPRIAEAISSLPAADEAEVEAPPAERAGADDGGQEEDDEVVGAILELLDSRVRPSVQMDGGDVVFDRFEDGIVYLHMHGACSGCPSSTATLRFGIENLLKHYVPEVVAVRPASP